MPPKDPELVSLRKELEDLIAKCQVNTCKSMYFVRICLLLLLLKRKCIYFFNSVQLNLFKFVIVSLCNVSINILFDK